MKQDKMVSVYVLLPHDVEIPVMYFTTKKQADSFKLTLKDSGVVTGPDLVPERIVNKKARHIAKNGYRL